ncbi:MAG: hypothetical protein VX874_06995 [Pseudomonadota bacterium]|nr:hypothetical protein [Pseudomonadota bacterium]
MKSIVLAGLIATAASAASADVLLFVCAPEEGDVWQEVTMDTAAPETVTLMVKGGYDMTDEERTHVLKQGARSYQYFDGEYGFDVDDIINALVWTHEYPSETVTCDRPEEIG